MGILTGHRVHIARGLAMAATSAVMFRLAFPPYDLWLLIFVGMVPMIVAVHRVLPQELAEMGAAVGIGGFFWSYFGGMFAGTAGAFMEWLPLGIAVVAGAVGSRERPFHRRTGYRWLVLQGAVVWVGIEMIRGLVPLVGTWGLVAYSLHAQV